MIEGLGLAKTLKPYQGLKLCRPILAALFQPSCKNPKTLSGIETWQAEVIIPFLYPCKNPKTLSGIETTGRPSRW